MAVFVGIQFYQNNVRADLFDFAPGDLIFAVFSEKSPELFIAGGNEGQDAAVFGVEDQVGDGSQPLTVLDIDYVFFS